jgi:gliding motility-associated-like protein
VQLQARSFGSNWNYLWSPPVGLTNPTISNPVFSYDITMNYLVRITNSSGCSVTDSLLVKVASPSLIPPNKVEVFVPTGWSPNGDGHNDLLQPFFVNVKIMNYFRVYNRWGQLVFESKDPSPGWDGTFNGRKLMSDTYSWEIEVLGNDDKKYLQTGRSVLIR